MPEELKIQPENIESNFVPIDLIPLNIVPSGGGSILNGGYLQSPNYVVGVSGWKIDANGDAELRSGKFAGTLYAPSGYLGHIVLCPVCYGYIRAGQTDYNTGTGFWLGLDSAGVSKFSIGDASANYLTWDGTTLAVGGNIITTFKVGNCVVNSNDAEAVTVSETYTKVKETQLGKGGNLRIKFNLKSPNGGGATAKIYKNGEAVGTERHTHSETYVNYSEDITGWAIGDLVQIYGKQEGGTFSLNNFRIYVNITDVMVNTLT